MTHRTTSATGIVAGLSSALAALLLALLGVAGGPAAPAHAVDQSTCLRNGMVWVATGGGGAACVSPGSGQSALTQAFGAGAIKNSPNGMICQIAGYPGVNNCSYARDGWDPATQEYLVYWHYYPCDVFPSGFGGNACNQWVYSQMGATGYVAPGGSVDYWQYGTTQAYPALAVAPVAPPVAPPPPATMQAPVQPAEPAAPTTQAAPAQTAPAETQPAATQPADVPTQAATTQASAVAATATAPTADATTPSTAPSTTATASASATTASAAASATAQSATTTPADPSSGHLVDDANPNSPVGTIVALTLVAAVAGGGGGWYLWQRRRA